MFLHWRSVVSPDDPTNQVARLPSSTLHYPLSIRTNVGRDSELPALPDCISDIHRGKNESLRHFSVHFSVFPKATDKMPNHNIKEAHQFKVTYADQEEKELQAPLGEGRQNFLKGRRWKQCNSGDLPS
ncbi:hypothetical protein J6590_088795 [Homalodisca vitripennis]|nr:hypothetical protein J6590_088795 [Homalodisca vitripennis]